MSEACVSSTTASCGSVRPADAPPPPPLRLLLVTGRAETAAPLAAAFDPAFFAVTIADEDAVPIADSFGEDFDADSGRAARCFAEQDAVLVDLAPGSPGALQRAVETAARLRNSPLPVLVVGGHLPREDRIALYRAGAVGFVDAGDDGEEVAARIASLLVTKPSTTSSRPRRPCAC